jgi:hypothetical protein
MTSLPQTLTFTAHDGRRSTSPVPSSPQSSRDARGGTRQALPAVDPSNAFGCVDWFLYPDQVVGRSGAEVQVTLTPRM